MKVAERSGADILVQCLVDLGVDTVFGYPGGAVLPIYDAIYNHPTIKHILVRHEQGATPRRGNPTDPVMHESYRPAFNADAAAIDTAVEMLASAERPILYTGGGVINAGPEAAQLLRELAALTGAPVTSTLMGLGAFPASSPQWLGMLGMHGSFEANNAMHDCDVMVAIGARFDDRVTGRLDAFAPGSRKIHIDVDASSIGKNVRCDIGIVGDA